MGLKQEGGEGKGEEVSGGGRGEDGRNWKVGAYHKLVLKEMALRVV
jgi:hypothetical protein